MTSWRKLKSRELIPPVLPELQKTRGMTPVLSGECSLRVMMVCSIVRWTVVLS